MTARDIFGEISEVLTEMGGATSGHYGHAGRPGQRGGSAPSGGKKFGSSSITGSKELDDDKSGINESVILEFADGSRGIFKSARDMKENGYGSAESEILAYEFSESIGWDIVPETIEYTYKGEGGSLQKWVPNSETAMDRREFRPREWTPRFTIMDALLGNVDRHAGNVLYDEEGKMWAIDNGGAFGFERFGRQKDWFWTGSIAAKTPENVGVAREVYSWFNSPKGTKYANEVKETLGEESYYRFRSNVYVMADWAGSD